MKDFIEVTLANGEKIVLNVSTIQSVYNNHGKTIIGLLKGTLDGIEVKESYEEILYQLIPSKKPKDGSSGKSVAKGTGVR